MMASDRRFALRAAADGSVWPIQGVGAVGKGSWATERLSAAVVPSASAPQRVSSKSATVWCTWAAFQIQASGVWPLSRISTLVIELA